MPSRKKPAQLPKKLAQPPKLQKLDAEWKAFIKNAQKLEPSTAPWPDPSGAPLKGSKKKIAKASARKPSRKAAAKRDPAHK